MWFEYPIHTVDNVGVLKDVQPEEEKPAAASNGKTEGPMQKKKERRSALESAFDACNIDGRVTISDISNYMGVTEKTVRSRLKEHNKFVVENGVVTKKEEGK